MAEIEPGLRLHYITAGKGDRVIVLLHGFPETWWEWHRVIPFLTAAGYRIVAPDYRGAGNSSRTLAGYDKLTMAGDIHRLLRNHLEITGPVILVGHDMGLMVAYAYAQAYRDDVSHLAIIDAPIPGTEVFDRIRSSPKLWHFAFHGARDIAEMLVEGRERQYLQAFFNARIFDPSALSEDAFDKYVTAYSAAGAMRAGFELYRTFDRDAEDNREALRKNGKLTIPTLVVSGGISNTGPFLEEMMHEIADKVTAVRIPRTAHWVPEEAPEELARVLAEFLGR